MTQILNALGQPIGFPVADWTVKSPPPRTPMRGRFVDLEPLDPSHGPDLFAAFSNDKTDAMWTYMPVGPFATLDDLNAWIISASAGTDPLFFAIIDKSTGRAVGFASYLRVDPTNGVVEVGFIAFSPLLQRTPLATEAMFLMMARVFNDMGYRRYEWKCDALNAPSRAAAKRLGFTYDGLFEQATIYKGRNRDTAWFSILDRDWPTAETAFTAWLDPSNFDASGAQLKSLADLRTP